MFGMTVEETVILVWCAILLINNVELIFKYRSNKDKYIELQDSGALFPVSQLRLTIGILIGTFIFKGLIYIFAAFVLHNLYAKIFGFLLLVLRLIIGIQDEETFRKSKWDLVVLLLETGFVVYFMLGYFFFGW
ncbi:hypothetical protein [Rossellomorea sp. KS-H15a]|uniref:hypothetical protein n=1 Tax=Rossellomorea sp. KS-H15a TaxID=2963940 RepID=UPI0020C6EB74|nr:hypothetical protein [Rossellomorea sp. KS-H15a]UTE78334.1 hypothetical protein M1J35_06090 [Rossellomorea sp. KS-H15a]